MNQFLSALEANRKQEVETNKLRGARRDLEITLDTHSKNPQQEEEESGVGDVRYEKLEVHRRTKIPQCSLNAGRYAFLTFA